MHTLFITGIGTDIGKTLVSAIITEKLQTDYWKPVQAGGLDHTDTDEVKGLISNTKSKFHPESYRLNTPASPHYAAAVDSIIIDLNKIILPETENTLIIEGAGGIMVPLNEKELVLDLIEKLGAEVILVSRNYLGSINHTLMSYEVLKSRNLKITGIIFNGESTPASEDYILNYTGLKCLGKIPMAKQIDKNFVMQCTGFIDL